MTFEERLDPALLEAYAASPEIDLGRNIPKLRFLIERYEAPLRAALPPDPRSHRHRSPGARVERQPRCARAHLRTRGPGRGFGRDLLDPRRRHGHRHHRRRRLHVQDVGARLRVHGRIGRLSPRARAPVPRAHRRLLHGLAVVPHPPRRLPSRSFTSRHRRRRAREAGSPPAPRSSLGIDARCRSASSTSSTR